MPRHRAIEGRITEYFETSDLAVAQLMLQIVTDMIARREGPKKSVKVKSNKPPKTKRPTIEDKLSEPSNSKLESTIY
jgi:hypothetical protein